MSLSRNNLMIMVVSRPVENFGLGLGLKGCGLGLGLGLKASGLGLKGSGLVNIPEHWYGITTAFVVLSM